MNKYDYKNICPFKWFILENFPFIEDDFDSLTNWQLFCKIGKEINRIINSQNNVGNQMEIVTNAFIALEDFVNNYFDNLDMQDEINNKLDDLVRDGTLTELISTYLNPYIESQNHNIELINNKVNSIYQNTPIPVTSVSEMTDTTKPYLMPNGYWYYYDGTDWVEGGLYQSSSIGNGAISFIELSDTLASNFNAEYGEIITPLTTTPGFYSESSAHNPVLNSNASYECFIIDLVLNKTYCFTGFNSYGASALLIVNNDGKVIYNSNTNTSAETVCKYIFKANDNGLHAYISRYTNDTNVKKSMTFLRDLTNIYNNLKIAPEDMMPLYTLNNKVIYYSTQTIDSFINIVNQSGYNIDVYPMSKGAIYDISTINYYQVVGCVITDLLNNIKYVSSTENVESGAEDVNYKFTATTDGFIYLVKSSVIQPTIKHSFDAIDIKVEIPKNLKNVKYVAFGDSLTDSNTLADEDAGHKNYVNYVTESLELNTTNMGVGGSGYKKGNSFVNRVSNIPTDTDIITIFGSFNDYQYIADSLGTITDTTTDTLYGCMNKFFTDLFIRCPSIVAGIILPTKWGYLSPQVDPTAAARCDLYIQALIDIAKKYDIPVLDLYHYSNLRPWDSEFKNLYYRDDNHDDTPESVHPNDPAHRKFIAPKVQAFIEQIYHVY